jgi:hypothetical protein
MTVDELSRELRAEGVRIQLTEYDTLKVIGEDAALTKWVSIIRDHKPQLVQCLRSWNELEAAIQACCDSRNDGAEHRAALFADCWEEPSTDWPSLSDIFARMSCCR